MALWLLIALGYLAHLLSHPLMLIAAFGAIVIFHVGLDGLPNDGSFDAVLFPLLMFAAYVGAARLLRWIFGRLLDVAGAETIVLAGAPARREPFWRQSYGMRMSFGFSGSGFGGADFGDGGGGDGGGGGCE